MQHRGIAALKRLWNLSGLSCAKEFDENAAVLAGARTVVGCT